MFTHEEAVAKVPLYMAGPKPPIETLSFNSDDGEGGMEICRATKTDFDNALHFWVKSIQSIMGWTGEENPLAYLHDAECQPMAEQEFMEMLGYIQGMKQPIDITPKGKYLSSMQMKSEWDQLEALAEFENEYIFLIWWTAA